jgi:hypothetical protein
VFLKKTSDSTTCSWLHCFLIEHGGRYFSGQYIIVSGDKERQNWISRHRRSLDICVTPGVTILNPFSTEQPLHGLLSSDVLSSKFDHAAYSRSIYTWMKPTWLGRSSTLQSAWTPWSPYCHTRGNQQNRCFPSIPWDHPLLAMAILIWPVQDTNDRECKIWGHSV